HRIRRGKRRLPNRQQQRLCRRGMGRPSSQESLQLKHLLQPLFVPLNPRSGLEPSESNLQRCVSHVHDRVLRNLATTHALSQLHIQPIFAPNETDRLVHRLSFRRNPTLQLFLELRRRNDRNRLPVTHTYSSAGSYTAALTVKESSSPQQTATAQMTVAVTSPPPPISASFTLSPSSPSAGQSVSFAASASGGTPP